MTASMADVLAAHWAHYCGLDRCTCKCGEPIGHWGKGGDMKAHQAHQAEALLAAGFGDVREAAATAWDEGYTTGNAHNGRRDANPYRKASS